MFNTQFVTITRLNFFAFVHLIMLGFKLKVINPKKFSLTHPHMLLLYRTDNSIDDILV